MKFLCVLCVLCGFNLPSSALDREAFTFTNYNLNVRIEPEQQRLAVRGTITVRNDSSVAQKNLSLQISSTLDWRSIQVEGKQVQFVSQPYTSDIDHSGAVSEAIVSLSKEVLPKASVELQVGYEGTIPLDTTRLTRIGVPEDQARHSDWDRISSSFTAVRGIGYVVWYPVAMEAANLSEGSSLFAALGRWKARESSVDVRTELTHSGEGEPLMLLCNGRSGGASSYEQLGRAYLVTTACTFPGSTVPIFVISDHKGLDRPTVNISYLPDHLSAAEAYGLAVDLAVPFVSEWFGAPKSKAELIDLPDPVAAAFESGTLTLLPLSKSDSRLAQLTAVHQLSHAAFPSPRPWIYEGLAHFAQAAYREQQNGRQAALDFMDLHRAALVDAEKALATEQKPDLQSESLINTSREEFYRSKAMFVWWMLRDIVGEETLKKALGKYLPEQDNNPSYMQHLVEAQGKKDLRWFFDDWVYNERGLPDFRVKSAYSRVMPGAAHVVTVTIENLGDAGAEVPVTMRLERGEITKNVEVRGKSTASIRMEAPSAPQEVVVNDGSVPESNLANNSFKLETSSK
jgi:hypothetical protein